MNKNTKYVGWVYMENNATKFKTYIVPEKYESNCYCGAPQDVDKENVEIIGHIYLINDKHFVELKKCAAARINLIKEIKQTFCLDGYNLILLNELKPYPCSSIRISAVL